MILLFKYGISTLNSTHVGSAGTVLYTRPPIQPSEFVAGFFAKAVNVSELKLFFGTPSLEDDRSFFDRISMCLAKFSKLTKVTIHVMVWDEVMKKEIP